MTAHSGLDALTTPAVIIDAGNLRENIAAMQALADEYGVALRPHIKTHKSPVIAKMQREAGAKGIACATVDEAEAMVSAGFDDIEIANEVVGRARLARLAALASKVRICCAVDSKAHVAMLSSAAASQRTTIGVLVDVDTGLHRCGVSDYDSVRSLAKQIVESSGLDFRGIMTHGGHAYGCSPDSIPLVALDEGAQMVALAERLRADGLAVETVSVGSTPTSRRVVTVAGVTELRVGNYVFYDMIQAALGSCNISQCSLSVLATVISVPSATRAVVDAGSKALTNDKGAHGGGGLPGFGFIPEKEVWLTRLSEEHGVIEHDGVGFEVGERVRIIPNHACPVMNLVEEAYIWERDELVSIEVVGRR